MLRFILFRIFAAIPTILIVSVAVFMIVRLVPGDPAELMLGDLAKPEQVEALRQQMGLDQPFHIQYLRWIENAVGGDLGVSISSGKPVQDLVVDRLLVTAPIVLLAVFITSVLAVPLGMLAAWRKNTAVDVSVVSVSTLMLSVPGFWLGLMILFVFSAHLGWFPVVGFVSIYKDLAGGLLYMVMPVMTLVFVELGAITRMMRANTISVAGHEYIAHARAKGLSENSVMRKHALKNSFAPTWTLIGFSLGSMLGGVAITETVFTIPGLGRLLVDSIYARDYPVVQGCLMVITMIYVTVNLMVDLVYPLLNPRIKL